MAHDMGSPDPIRLGDLVQVRELCATHIAALHDLQFLMRGELQAPSASSEYLNQMTMHLDSITDALCRL